jgi:type IV secretory pathway VirB6-like protein
MIKPDDAYVFLDMYNLYNNLLADFIIKISDRLVKGVNLKYVHIIGQITVTLAFLGVLVGRFKPSLNGIAYHVIYFGVVILLASNSNGFGSKIADMLFKLPDDLISVVYGGSGDSKTSVGLVDKMFAALFGFYEKMDEVAWTKASVLNVPDLGILALAIILLGASVFLCSICAGILLIGKMGLAICLAIAPLFILCLMSPLLTKYFNGWVTAIASFVILPVMGSVFCELFYQALYAIAGSLKDGWVDNVVYSMIPTFVFLGITLYMLKNLTTLVRDIVGGSAYSTPNIGGAIYNSVNKHAARPILKSTSNTTRKMLNKR